LYVVAELNAWLAGRGLSAEDLTGPVAGRFWEDLRARGSYLVKGAALEPLLSYLRSIGVLPQQADGAVSAAGVLLLEYERYLRVERRAGEVTIAHYLGYADEFLSVAGGLPDGLEFDARLAALDSAQVLDIVSRQVDLHRLPSVGAAFDGRPGVPAVPGARGAVGASAGRCRSAGRPSAVRAARAGSSRNGGRDPGQLRSRDRMRMP
jgi:hypothetical protein